MFNGEIFNYIELKKYLEKQNLQCKIEVQGALNARI